VEEHLDLSAVTAAPAPPAPPAGDLAEHRVLRDVDAEVDGRRYRVKLWVPESAGAGEGGGGGGGAAGPVRSSSRGRSPGSTVATGDGRVTVPMQGTIVKVLVSEGDTVEMGQTICVLEAMKMENPINADRAGTVKDLKVQTGDALGAGDIVAVIS
jgi:acetyl-CoA/propionyl-CoA carboxylase biotin carboxyl carrier protein